MRILPGLGKQVAAHGIQGVAHELFIITNGNLQQEAPSLPDYLL